MRLARLPLTLAALALLVIALGYFLSRTLWIAEWFNIIRPPLVVLAILVGAACFYVRAIAGTVVSVLAVVASVYVLIAPLQSLERAGSGIGGRELVVVTYDVAAGDPVRFKAWLDEIRPDVVALQEMDQGWRVAVTQWSSVLPYYTRATHRQDIRDEIVSRFPIRQTRVYAPLAGRTAVTAELDVEGRTLDVFTLEPDKPKGPSTLARRDAYIALVAQWIGPRAARQPTLLMGVWNLTPWSPAFGDLLELTNLTWANRDLLPASTRGAFGASVLGPSVDHIAVSRNLPVTRCDTHDLGSAHLALVCRVRLR